MPNYERAFRHAMSLLQPIYEQEQTMLRIAAECGATEEQLNELRARVDALSAQITAERQAYELVVA